MRLTRSHRKRAALVAAALVIVGATAFAFGSRRGVGKRAAPAQAPASRLEVELLTVTSDGFTPKVINRPPGPFILLLDNQSGEELDALQLDPEGASHLPAHLLREAVHRGISRSTRQLDLPPGSYIFQQAGRANWSCSIVVDPGLAAR
jgi:hypothetical protein